MKPHIFIFVGLPASGKTTLRRSITDVLGVLQPYSTVEVASSDDVLERIAVEQGISYKEAFNLCYGRAQGEYLQAIRAFQDKLEETDCTTMRSLIVDRTNTTVKGRKSILMPFNRYGEKIVRYAVFLRTPPTECVKRDNARLPGRGVGAQVISFMHERLVAPTLAEGFDHVCLGRDELLEKLNQTAV